MITTTKTNNLKIKTSFVNKQILIRMAKDGKDKPNYKTKLGAVLGSYISKTSNCYDSDFDKIITKLRPDWFKIKIKHNVAQNKETLIYIAKKGKPRPGQKTKLGGSLKSYTKKYSKCYDSDFDKQIRKLRPDWFVSQSYFSTKNKEYFIQIAKNGKSKPKFESKLRNYTQKTSASYDPNFDKLIRTLRPDWFKVKNNSIKNKQKIISMAENGQRRPKQKTKIGKCLCKYIRTDFNFYKKLKATRPDWFVSQSQIATQKKQELIRMAKSGETRPIRDKTKIGQALSNYTNKSSQAYDSMFNKQIRNLRLDWFKK